MVYGFTLAVVLGAAGFWWAASEYKKPGPLQQSAIVDIKSGANVGDISDMLFLAQVIDNPIVFTYSAIVLGKHRDLKAGEYEFPPQVSMREAMDQVMAGDIIQRRVTVREGLTSHEILALLSGLTDIQQTPIVPVPEGTLLPETYNYKNSESTADVVNRMESAMTKTIDELWETRAPNLPFTTKQEALTLASIVEKETGVPEERKRVAGVFINRLRQGIALQTDPTVIYAITKGKHKNEGKGPLGRRLLSKDLEIDSPYNTYKYAGLPPGPIANPGRASIEAVLNPEEHNFIYFVADGSGGHIFAATLEEHNKNVAEWRKIRKERQD